jgi:hypothetical protein
LLVQRIVCEFIPNQDSVGITDLNKGKKRKKRNRPSGADLGRSAMGWPDLTEALKRYERGVFLDTKRRRTAGNPSYART